MKTVRPYAGSQGAKATYADCVDVKDFSEVGYDLKNFWQ